MKSLQKRSNCRERSEFAVFEQSSLAIVVASSESTPTNRAHANKSSYGCRIGSPPLNGAVRLI